MKFLKGLKSVGKTVVSPFTSTVHGVSHIVDTAHHDLVGVTKGAYNITQGLSNSVGTSLTQLTSPTGLIAIAVVIGAIALISISRK